jgi:phenylpropionate dioxygenase-like ring-hydroxylating dioxygenase large terminal subunit
LSGAALEDALAPLRRAKSMPAELYTSPEVFALERERLFLKHWLFLCREEQVAGKGDYKTFDTLGGPILLVRGQDDVLRCFANYCRHRGSLLLQGSGNCGARIMCPYHAWSYFSDGRLYGCPDMKDAEGFDRTENGLVPVRIESWAGFIFATFSDSTKPLAEHLGDLPQRFGSHRLDEMRCVWTMSIPVACNWKLILENAMETYHTGVVHRDTVGAQIQRPIPTKGDWLCMQVLSRRSIGTMNATVPPLPQIEGLDEDAQQGTYFSVIHPSVQFAVSQDCMWWLNVKPVDAGQSILELGGCFPEGVLSLPGFEHNRKLYEERWERVAREDMGVLENQQIALSSVLFRPGPLSGRDDMVQAVGRWNVLALEGSL